VRLTLLAREPAALRSLADRLLETATRPIETVELDLADENALKAWIEAHQGELADVDLLVNNAAHAEAAPFLELDEAHIHATFATNLFAPMSLARAVLPAMIARRHGHLLNVVTSGARNALPLFSSYAASKGALWSWSESLARELDGTGVHVTTMVPPLMDTSTRNQLVRRAVAWYDPRGHRDATTPVDRVASLALSAARRGRRMVAPHHVKWQLAFNALAPGPIEAAIRRRWRERPDRSTSGKR
jgi:short-subunit dehydrogenase